MEMPTEFYDFIAKFKDKEDLIENLFLKSLIDSFSRVKNIENIYNISENKIRNEFQFDLTYINKLTKQIIENGLITFTAENQIINYESEVKRTDIQFIITGLVTYVVECKKLKGISKAQYIDSGINRFIENIYISKNEEYAGMCSFIVSKDVKHIISGTKERVKQYNFVSLNDNLICDFENSFSSTHKKVDGYNIQIHHLFFDMNNINA